MHGPRRGAIDEERLLFASLPPQPVIDRVRCDRRGRCPDVLRRRASQAGELLEAPMAQRRCSLRPLAQREGTRGDRFGPQIVRLDGSLHGADAPSASCIVKRLHALVPLVGWTSGPFPIGGIRRNCGHTNPIHGCAFQCLRGGGWESAPRRQAVRGEAAKTAGELNENYAFVGACQDMRCE